MIKSTHPEFEKLITGQAVNSTPELLEFLNGIGVPHMKKGTSIVLKPELELLDETVISEQLQPLVPKGLLSAVDVEIHRVTSSTNDVVMQRLAEKQVSGILCTAEMQTAGKGRRGRHWISPFGRNIYLTYGRFVDRQLSALGGLSLVIGMVVVDVLRSMGLEQAALKWPNDILLDDGKLGGILVELRTADARGIGIVCGVGINLALQAAEAAGIDQPWSAASAHLKMPRNVLLGRLAASMMNAIQVFEEQGFKPFVEKWDEYNCYSGQQVNVIRGSEIISGIDSGVDQEGNLVLRTDAGLETHNSGEVSVRPVSLT